MVVGGRAVYFIALEDISFNSFDRKSPSSFGTAETVDACGRREDSAPEEVRKVKGLFVIVG